MPGRRWRVRGRTGNGLHSRRRIRARPSPRASRLQSAVLSEPVARRPAGPEDPYRAFYLDEAEVTNERYAGVPRGDWPPASVSLGQRAAAGRQREVPGRQRRAGMTLSRFAPGTERSGCPRKPSGSALAEVLPRARSIRGATASRRRKTRSSALRIPTPFAATGSETTSAFAT